MEQGLIRICGARQHNLQGVDVDIKRGTLTVITGVSGSGKSSLAFHTLYAEGQRRYVESLSAYARQFLDQLEKPDVDRIEGLSPAIAIEQKSGQGNPRSTIATVTEIHDFLRILFSAVGIPHDPETGERLERMTVGSITEMIAGQPEGTRVMVMAPVPAVGAAEAMVADLQRQGFVRVRINGELRELEEAVDFWPDQESGEIEVVVDRLVVKEGMKSRLADSLEVALRICGEEVRALLQEKGTREWEEVAFATSYRNPRTGFVLPALTPKHFSFNSHVGACEVCHGLGQENSADPALIIPDRSKSLAEGAVALWPRAKKGKKQGWNQLQVDGLAALHEVDVNAPATEFPEEFEKQLLHGTGDEEILFYWNKDGVEVPWRKPFEGLCAQVERLYGETESDAVKRKMSRFMTHKPCRACGGARLRPEILAVKVDHEDGDCVGIADFLAMGIGSAAEWIKGVGAGGGRMEVLTGVKTELEKRLGFLERVGLGYLSLDRSSNTLSGGEFQRVRLATQLGSGLSGVIYILDEPSIGLHAEDNDRLIAALTSLRDTGNTVVVVEHDEAMVRAADEVVEIGPEAGEKGGLLVAQGAPDQLAKLDTATGRWLSQTGLALNDYRRKKHGELVILEPTENNLQGDDVVIPLGQLVAVTGPSGSGKSTLVDTILRRALARHFHRAKEIPGKHRGLEGLEQIERVVTVDQSPLGKSPRSNAATYTGVFDLLRDLFSKLPLSRQRGYGAGRFSFNVKGGRCEKCQGGGALRIDMHFLPDVWVECEACQGQRYNRETLEVRYRGKNVAEVLEMTVAEAVAFFERVPKVDAILSALKDVGLGYLRLGQAANTLSGGESQRVKLATELSKSSYGHVLYLLDEPTTGLHYQDVMVLLEALAKLRDDGHSVLVIEHSLEVIAACDWVIDLGPGGGVNGGRVVATGTPKELAAVEESATGRALKKSRDLD